MTIEQARTLLAQHSPLPKLVVVDLDYTVWPYWCEMFSADDEPWLYPQVPAIFQALGEQDIPIAVASRTPTPDVAAAFLRKLHLQDRFVSTQLIPAADGFDHHTAQKDTCHLPNIRRETGIQYHHMVFFDDEHKNVAKVSKLGVLSHLVNTKTGLDLKALEAGLSKYAQRHVEQQ